MIYYKCFVCSTEMESPSCLAGSTEKCPQCAVRNWVPQHSVPGCEAAFLAPVGVPARPGGGGFLKERLWGPFRKWRTAAG